SSREQSLPALRFWEMQDYVRAGGLKAGVKPPLIGEMMEGLLGSPIGLGITPRLDPARRPEPKDEWVTGLGITPGADRSNLAEGLMLGLISYLRHGLLYYHYAYVEIPEKGPGSGEYGPINHMFPFTPVGLHEGWMEDRERTIACL